MNTRNLSNKLYDVFTGEVIEWEPGKLISTFKSLGLDYTNIYKLHDGLQCHIKHRYTIEKYLDRVFTLVNIDTGEEYKCITNASIFVQLGIPYNDNEGKYVYELKSGRQARASINGCIYILKGGKTARLRRMKAKSVVLSQQLEKAEQIKKEKMRIISRVLSGLRGKKVKKNHRTAELIGCTYAQLHAYIESKFVGGMNWGNRNLWHIDHITPVVAFNLSDPRQLRLCFHYSNLQPIWKTTEIAKQMGEPDWYIGNMNKNDNTDHCFDYFAAKRLKEKMPHIDPVPILKELNRRGLRKMII